MPAAAAAAPAAAPGPAAEKTAFFAERVRLFEEYKARSQAELEAARAKAEPITITLPDGNVKAGVKWVTTPADVAASISKSLAALVVVAKVDDAAWDVFRPLEGSCALKLCTFEDDEGRDVRAARRRRSASGGLTRAQTFWHSSAHVLGEVLELTYGCDLTIGPSLEEGFYYDCFLGDRSLTEDDCRVVEKAMEKVVKARLFPSRLL